MAKEQCAICGEYVGGIYKMRLGDGNIVCTNCWNRAKTGFGSAPKQFTLDSFREHMATDPKAIAAREKRELKEERREVKEMAAQIKQDRKNQEALEKLGLDLDKYDDAELREKKNDDVQQMAATLLGSKFMSAGALLSGDPRFLTTIEMARVQIAQSNIIIRQNEEIIRLLQRLADAE